MRSIHGLADTQSGSTKLFIDNDKEKRHLLGMHHQLPIMKKDRAMKACIYAATVLILFFCPAMLCAQEIENGYNGIRWRTAINDLKSFAPLGENGPVAYYTNPNEIHQLYGEDVPGVIYGFYKGSFFAVFIKIDSLELFSKIKEHLTNKYGTAEISFTAKSEQTIYKWNSGDIKIKLKRSETERTMKLVFYFTPLSSKVNEDDLEAAQRKSPRLFPIKKGKVPEVVPLLEF
jgi:hypothetical protein